MPEKKPFIIGISGKGGVGKTTIASLMVRCLIRQGIRPVLAVDADPNANLHEALGIEVTGTLGSMREEAFTKAIPPGMSRTEYIHYRFRQVLVESEGFDLIAMGRPEGQGCYCFANDLLTQAMQSLQREYPVIIIDNEAGMEHLARGTIGLPDILVIVTDPGARGMRTADRIMQIGREIGMSEERMLRIVNRAPENYAVPDWVYATIPLDPLVEEAEMKGDPVSLVPRESLAAVSACTIIRDVFHENQEQA
ncbi:MAG: AAA family ATPase [Methanospirillum sp.]|nr:AAA family ATPase [Methanospirillum sp.]